MNKNTKKGLGLFIVFLGLIFLQNLFFKIPFLTNTEKSYMFEVIMRNIIVIPILIVVLILIINTMRKPKEILKLLKNKNYIINMIFYIAMLILTTAWNLPLDKDLGIMITKTYSEADGTIIDTIENYNKSRNSAIVIHDDKQDKDITIEFTEKLSSKIKKGMNINIKYLPYTLRGISYFN